MKSLLKGLGSLLAVTVLCAGLVAQTASAARYDSDIQARGGPSNSRPRCSSII